MKKITTLFLLVSLFFVSCASKFTPAQKTQLSSLNVVTPTYGENSYKKPTGAADMSANDAAVASGGGLIGALVGHLIVEGVAAGQRSGFKSKYGNAAENAKASIPSNLANTLKSKNEWAVNSMPQLNGRVNNSSFNLLKTTITSYGYKRTGKSDSRILVTPYIYGNITLSLDGENVIESVPIIAQAYEQNSGGHEISEYVSNKSLATSDFTKACEKFAENVKATLEAKY